MAYSQTFFENAQNFSLNDVQFINTTTHDLVSTTFHQAAAISAIFDSGELFPRGKCHPGTRQKIIEKIIGWIDVPDPAQRILWLHGPAGSGKSALAHSICELLMQSDPAKYAASFFFARGSTDRGKSLKLFATLAYQLAVQLPAIRSEINTALYNDPSLPTKSMEIQLLHLIIYPFLRCQTVPSHNPTIIIDGLDECAEGDGLDTQRNIILLIAKSVIKYDVPLRFIIASRPEAWIRDTFEISPLPNLTLPLSLRDDVDADKDIRVYLTNEFEKIRLENKRIMGSVVLPWPPANVVDRFVYEASGQFIYASTVLKFVGRFQLRIITSPGPHRSMVFSELDRLYASVLAAYPRWETMKRVLSGLLVSVWRPPAIEVTLGIDHSELMLVLDALRSVVDITQRELSACERLLEPIFGSLSAAAQRISFSHLSFREFLGDEQRSGPYYVDIAGIAKEMTGALFGIIRRNFEQGYNMEPHVLLNVDLIGYHCVISEMIGNVIAGDVQIDTILPFLVDMTQRLLFLDLNKPMKYPGCFLRDLQHIEDMLDIVKYQLDAAGGVFRLAKAELQDALLQVQKRAICLLWSSNQFQITPTLVYIQIFTDNIGATANMLFTIPNNTIADTLSTLRQHRHIIILEDLTDDYVWSVQFLRFKSLVQCLYGLDIEKGPRLPKEYELVETSFRTYIIECLPYARPTQQNLDALRAAVYFSGKLTTPWHPPLHFCSLTMEFLNKYERSVLSSRELTLFARWLFDLEKLEVNRCSSSVPSEL